MKQLTVRGFDKDLQRTLRETARRRGLSLNQAAIHLLRKGAGLGDSLERADVVGDSLDHLIGSWSAADEEEILEAVGLFEEVDRALWR